MSNVNLIISQLDRSKAFEQDRKKHEEAHVVKFAHNSEEVKLVSLRIVQITKNIDNYEDAIKSLHKIKTPH